MFIQRLTTQKIAHFLLYILAKMQIILTEVDAAWRLTRRRNRDFRVTTTHYNAAFNLHFFSRFWCDGCIDMYIYSWSEKCALSGTAVRFDMTGVILTHVAYRADEESAQHHRRVADVKIGLCVKNCAKLSM